MSATFPTIRLNPALNPKNYAQTYADQKFVQIPEIFEPEVAQAISEMLAGLPWRLAYSTPEEGIVQLTREEMQRIGQQELGRRMSRVMELATRNYGYCYNVYHMTGALNAGRDEGHPVHKLTEFLNSPEFIAFGEQVIDEVDQIRNVDCQATLYTRGSFLTRHIDDGAFNERRCAYTLGFTKGWMTDWGGLTMFLDKNTDIEAGYLPRWNVLTLFDGRRIHSVSAVSAFAGSNRLSVAGWLRNN